MQIRTNAATGTVKTTTRGLQNMMDRQCNWCGTAQERTPTVLPLPGILRRVSIFGQKCRRWFR